jgi:hypothetical protein
VFFDGAIASGSAFSFVDRQCGKIIGSSRYYAYNPAPVKWRSAGHSSREPTGGYLRSRDQAANA